MKQQEAQPEGPRWPGPRVSQRRGQEVQARTRLAGRESRCSYLAPTTANPRSRADLSKCSHVSSLAPNLALRGKTLMVSSVQSRRTSLGEGCEGDRRS